MNTTNTPWLAVQTFYCKELAVRDYLADRGLTCFVPMRYAEVFQGYDKKPHRELVPVVHNYLFVQKPEDPASVKTLLVDCPYASRLLLNKSTRQPSEISAREMFEFRALCDPDFNQQAVFQVDDEEAELGREVEIVHGQFAGIRGRLFRKKGQYWFIKTISDISVKLRITRWFCRAL